MEDKQIYTTARSEEIKRQFIALKDKFKKALNERSKKDKERKAGQQIETKVTTTPSVVQQSASEPTAPLKGKSQNIQISSESTPQQKKQTHKESKVKKDTPLLSREKIFNFFIYVLFAIIILIIAIGIFLTYYKR